MLIWVFSKRFNAESNIFIMALVPAAAGLFDYIENIGIVMMIKSYPNLSSGLVQFTSTFSILKSIMTIASYTLLVYGLSLLVVKRKRR